MTANANRTSAPVSSLDTLLVIEHSAFGNHNGGQLLFGPDGNLYIFTGDGGDAATPFENGQSTSTLLGKILRIDPNLSGDYDIPSGNPFAGGAAGNDELWDIGLRNPWRASFDRDTDLLWVADVGQGSWEEINRDLEHGEPELRLGPMRGPAHLRGPRAVQHELGWHHATDRRILERGLEPALLGDRRLRLPR